MGKNSCWTRQESKEWQTIGRKRQLRRGNIAGLQCIRTRAVAAVALQPSRARHRPIGGERAGVAHRKPATHGGYCTDNGSGFIPHSIWSLPPCSVIYSARLQHLFRRMSGMHPYSTVPRCRGQMVRIEIVFGSLSQLLRCRSGLGLLSMLHTGLLVIRPLCIHQPVLQCTSSSQPAAGIKGAGLRELW